MSPAVLLISWIHPTNYILWLQSRHLKYPKLIKKIYKTWRNHKLYYIASIILHLHPYKIAYTIFCRHTTFFLLFYSLENDVHFCIFLKTCMVEAKNVYVDESCSILHFWTLLSHVLLDTFPFFKLCFLYVVLHFSS